MTKGRDQVKLTGLLETVLRNERIFLGSLFGLLVLACWWWIVVMAGDMYGSMTGPAAWMMSGETGPAYWALLWAMWAVMMAAMMLPAAAPILLLHARAARMRRAPGSVSAPILAIAAGYLLVWSFFSVAATVLQALLVRYEILSPMMEPAEPIAAPALLYVAGIYQLTPLKHACLRACRSPLSFLMSNWRPGWSGALEMGFRHGAYCLGCCWALMLLLFAGGVMNLLVIGALTAWVIIEKLLPFGERGAYLSGVLLIATATWMLLAT